MRISVFGLGYVGCITSICLAQMGHQIIGVDKSNEKLQMIDKGKSPIIEEDIDEILAQVINKGNYRVTSNVLDAVNNSDVALICVGTPSLQNGSVDLRHVKKVTAQIGEALKRKNSYFVIAVRSTVIPGTIQESIIPIIEKHSNKKVGKDIGLCMCPEFMREGSSVHDFFHPPKTVIGEYDKKSGDILMQIFNIIEAPIFRTNTKVAEMVKYSDNCYHALKVVFANEIGNVCKAIGIDSHEVMDIFCADHKLNISTYYLKPGFAYGGSCLPKDLRALTYKAKHLDIETPVISSIQQSNDKHIKKVVDKILQYKGKRVGFLGLSFKVGTDDLRESPLVSVIEDILGKGFSLKIFDPYVSLAKLIGSNKEYIKSEIPHIASLMVESIEEVIENSDVIVIGNKSNEYKIAVQNISSNKVIVIDLVRIIDDWSDLKFTYYGICW